ACAWRAARARYARAGRAGASQDAPVSCNAGKANPVRFRPHEISLSSGGHNKPLQETPYGYNPHL
ncbi:ash family protein, partial [Pseudomonas aeruginosa]|uniref:ash family protein n=1 Tax=Pseudomonas aeruginosa TaxID=287 RepID=UPI003D1881A4